MRRYRGGGIVGGVERAPVLVVEHGTVDAGRHQRRRWRGPPVHLAMDSAVVIAGLHRLRRAVEVMAYRGGTCRYRGLFGSPLLQHSAVRKCANSEASRWREVSKPRILRMRGWE